MKGKQSYHNISSCCEDVVAVVSVSTWVVKAQYAAVICDDCLSTARPSAVLQLLYVQYHTGVRRSLVRVQ
jgi:hypothetical protein